MMATVTTNLLDGKRCAWMVGLLTLAIAVVLAFIREFQEKAEKYFTGVLYALLASLLVVCQVNEVFDFQEPESYETVVVETRRSGSRSRRCFCTILTEDGQELELHISQWLYNQLEVGDEVVFTEYPGALGIPYGEVAAKD